jgi:isoquinoline 1-oxidoreductase alpha subunit
LRLKINGREYRVAADPDTPLLWVIREHLGLTGTKFGCGMSICGACTVHIDGEAVRSCVTPAYTVSRRRLALFARDKENYH